MELGEMLAVFNLAGLMIVAFFGWNGIKAAKQQVMELVNRDFAEIRRQIRLSMQGLDRLRDHVADNREDILKIEVNLASMQDELEAMSRRLKEIDDPLAVAAEAQESEIIEASEETEEVPEQRHLYDR